MSFRGQVSDISLLVSGRGSLLDVRLPFTILFRFSVLEDLFVLVACEEFGVIRMGSPNLRPTNSESKGKPMVLTSFVVSQPT